MSDFPRITAQEFGVTVRTVRRWCETGKIPNAYRTRGGHWRLRKPSKALREKAWRRFSKPRFESFATGELPPKPTLRERLSEWVWLLSDQTYRERHNHSAKLLAKVEAGIAETRASFPGGFQFGYMHDRETQMIVQFSRVAHGITNADLQDERLHEHNPEKWRLIYLATLDEFVHPRAVEALRKGVPVIELVATTLRLEGAVVTPAKLAQGLGISVATLYRRYGQHEVNRIWSGDARPVHNRSGFEAGRVVPTVS